MTPLFIDAASLTALLQLEKKKKEKRMSKQTLFFFFPQPSFHLITSVHLVSYSLVIFRIDRKVGFFPNHSRPSFKMISLATTYPTTVPRHYRVGVHSFNGCAFGSVMQLVPLWSGCPPTSNCAEGIEVDGAEYQIPRKCWELNNVRAQSCWAERPFGDRAKG